MAAARAAGKPVATTPRQGKSWQALFDEGIDAIATGSEIYYFRVAAAQQMADWRRYRLGATDGPDQAWAAR